MTAKWQPGHTYTPGSLVIPRSEQAPAKFKAENGYFENGDTGWDWVGAMQFSTSGGYGSDNCCVVTGGRTDGEALNKAKFYGPPGTPIKAGCMIQQGASIAGTTNGCVRLHFYDANDVEITAPKNGNIVDSGKGGAYHPSTAETTFPSGAAYARAGIYIDNESDTHPAWGDNLVVDSLAPTVPPGLVYKAVQDAPGKSANGEPDWPGTTGVQVIDNEVIWEGIIASAITWEASPLCKSGDTEPEWPTEEGSATHDGNINWIAITPQVKDAPKSKIVTVAANKVFVGDDDIVRYCATNDALDWDTQDDAGYLPTGLQAVGETNCTALGVYRANLVAWTASSMQVWQVDPDPSRMAIVDSIEGVGNDYIRASAGVMNDMYFTSSLGVRSVGISATTGTIGADDVGSPVDALVRQALRKGVDPIGVFYANASQFWLFVDDTAFIFSLNRLNKVYAWSRYTFPWRITDACTLNGELYVRTIDDDVFALDERAATDAGAEYEVEVIWPWLDLGSPGIEKMLTGVDIVIAETPVNIDPIEIHGSLGNGTVGQAVDFRYTASGGIPGYSFRIAGGSLPDGLTMDAEGHVTGEYATAGDYSWTVEVTDAMGSVATLDDSCNVSIPPKNPIYIGYQNFPVDQFFQNDGSGGVLQTQPKSTAFGTYTSNSRGDLYTSQYGGAKIYRMVKDQQGIYSSIEQNINGYPFVSVKGMGISPSGAKLILCSGTTEESPGICLFSAHGEESFELDHTFVMYPNDPYESYMTTRISFSPDGSKVILWGSYSGDAWTLWDISGSTPQRLFGSASDGNSGSDVAWRPDGTKFIVAGSRQAVIYGIGVGDAVDELWSGGFDFYELTGSYRNIIAWSSEDVIFCGGTYTAYPLGVIYDVKSGSPVQVGTFDALNGPSNVVLSPDSSKLAISKYGGMKVYDVSGSTVTPSVSGDEGMDLISHL